MTNIRKIVRTGMVMSGLLLMGGNVVPAVAQTDADQGRTEHRDAGGFDNWGLLGLLGLAGLLGRKREREVTRTGNVPHTGRV